MPQPDVPAAPINPLASAPSITSAPDWRVVFGAIVGVVSGIILALLKRYIASDLLVPEIVSGVPVLVGFLVTYLTPMTRLEVANRLTNPIIKLANAELDNPTTAKIVTGIESDKETAKDVALGIIPDAIAEKLPPDSVNSQPNGTRRAGAR